MRALFNRLGWLVIVSLVFAAWASPVFAQHGTTGTPARVLALEQKIEEAIVRGDVAFVDRVTSDRLQLRARRWLDARAAGR